MISDEVLRRAIFDPAVRKRRVLGRQAGLLIDADDLHRSLADVVPDGPSAEEVDQVIRRHGGQRLNHGIARAIRSALRRLPGARALPDKRPEYWLDMYSWQKLRQRRG